MSTLLLKKLKDERQKLLEEAATLGSLLHGSWVERFSTCTRPQCKCHKGRRHGPRYYLVINDQGRQRQKYIPKKMIEKVRSGIANHKRLLEIVERITQINIILIREDSYESE